MEKGIYRHFYVKKDSLSFNTIKNVIEKYFRSDEIFEDGTIDISDGALKAHLRFTIAEKYTKKNLDQILTDRLILVRTDLDRLDKLKEDLKLLGIEKLYSCAFISQS